MDGVRNPLHYIVCWLVLSLMMGCGANAGTPRPVMASSASNTETIWRTPDSCHAIYEKEGRRFGITDITEACEALERHLQYLEGRLGELCEKAGEHIEKTIENVEGVYIHYPLGGPPYYHEMDRVVGSYVAPGDRKFYRFVEFDDLRTKSGIFHYASGEKQQKLSEPVSPYEVTWKRLTDARDQQRGLHGEELTITDRSTKNVLATRTIFYYVLTEQFLSIEGIYQQIPPSIPPNPSEYQIATCKTYHPVWDSPYTDKRRPRDSYGFVSRVLKPKEPAMASVIASLDLARGSGRKLDTCPMVIRVGPNIALADLQITNPLRFDVEISVKRTNDSLVCHDILHPTAKRRREHIRIFFYDGTSTSLTQLIQPFLYTDKQN